MNESTQFDAIMPVLFIGHGSPMNIISNNKYTEDLKKLGKSLPKPKAILVISAHWLTFGTKVTCAKNPKIIYDFYGFPPALYSIKYRSPGLPELANLITQKVKLSEVTCDHERGYDHASWAILTHMYPNADIPVIELSLDYGFNRWDLKPVEYHFRLAKDLAFLREEGVLIIGSGNIVHNLGLIDYNVDAPVVEWAKELDDTIKTYLLEQNFQKLLDLKAMGQIAKLGIPTWDHYLPLIYTIALRQKNESMKFPHEGFQHGSISMRCIRFG